MNLDEEIARCTYLVIQIFIEREMEQRIKGRVMINLRKREKLVL